MASQHKHRLVRKVPLWSRIVDAPADWFMGLAEEYLTFDWEVFQEAISWPTAVVLNGLFVVVKLWNWFDAPDSTIFDPNRITLPKIYQKDSLGGTFGFRFWLTAVEYALLTISLPMPSTHLFVQRNTASFRRILMSHRSLQTQRLSNSSTRSDRHGQTPCLDFCSTHFTRGL
jgi:hypothetical protein